MLPRRDRLFLPVRSSFIAQFSRRGVQSARSSSITKPGLDGHSESVRDAVDVGVVARAFADREHVVVPQALGAEPVDVLPPHGPGPLGQSIDVVEDRFAAGRQARTAPIGFDRPEQRVVLQQPTQTAPVMSQSIAAAVQLADPQRDQFAVDLAQARGASHRRAVERNVC